MEAFKHPLCNAILGAPMGAKDVSALPVQRGALVNDPCVRSFWKPTAEELEGLVQGGCVALCVLGTTHAPLSIDVELNAEAATLQDAQLEFEVTSSDGGYSTAVGPNEAMRYAERYVRDGGTVKVYAVRRTLVKQLP